MTRATRHVALHREIERGRLLALLERGELTATALLTIREHLTDAGAEEIVRAACGKSRAKVREMPGARRCERGAP